MQALVTGAAGFIGSRLVERLGADGHAIRAVDCLTDYYDVAQKRSAADRVRRVPGCEQVEVDLAVADLRELLDGIDVVFHQAGQPGVRESWRDGFEGYVRQNVLVTQRLLEACVGAPLRRFVFASSSSVYGDAETYPTTEETLPAPRSPYGVTKLAAEHLCGVYARNWDVPTVALRYFTVFGPGQRPDMAMHRIAEAALDGRPFPVYGDGTQVRDFTFVDDVVAANLAATRRDVPAGTVVNVSGGGSVSLIEVIGVVGDLVGRDVLLERRPVQPGDVRRTGGANERARRLLGWRPRVALREGLRRQVAWHRERRGAAAPALAAAGSAG